MFVKICGITGAEALAACVEAGADAVGFVFAESPRQIDPEDASDLCRRLPKSIVRVAVMRHPDSAALSSVFEKFRPDWLQTDAEDLATIELPMECRPLPVYRNRQVPASINTTDRSGPLLFEGHRSGAGVTADWDEARALARRCRLILAGGLSPANVGSAIAHVAPWGVDVSSGVESERGIKDPAKIEQFIARARAAETPT